MKKLMTLTEDEIYDRFHRKFIKLSDASDLVEQNSFAFPVSECLKVYLVVFDKFDTRFISVIDYLLFLKEKYIKIDLDDVELFMFTTDELENTFKIKGDK